MNDIPLQTGALTVFAQVMRTLTVTISADQLLEGFTDADGDFPVDSYLSASGGVISQGRGCVCRTQPRRTRSRSMQEGTLIGM